MSFIYKERVVLKHPKELRHGSLEDLAYEVESLRYDKASEFIYYLAKAFGERALSDKEAGRYKLSELLFEIQGQLLEITGNIDKVWKVCAPYMDCKFERDIRCGCGRDYEAECIRCGKKYCGKCFKSVNLCFCGGGIVLKSCI